eukprot:CAMPEP_0197023194 /NCGR_PEP_ID=MMETSP1384-20130603/3974_1 /TAXON_ID=29189 /ORGANISM="Ammonia sp." /LENGTH=213 /DNA_ID=CAMNT_0042451383 /DNA_START=161 /DNA_END=802 /DNA_ORIENTATION=+
MPTNVADVKVIANILSKYQDTYYVVVLIGFVAMYLFLQTFAIPGTLLLSILSGALFPWFIALLIVTACSTTGASLCYAISEYLARDLVIKWFPNKLALLQSKIEENGENIFFYLLFLRLTPLLPNWFINLAAPIINVQFIYFVSATCIGLIPANFMYIQFGMTLQSISQDTLENQGRFVLSYKSMLLLLLFAIMALVPTFFKKRIKRYRNSAD